MTADSSLRRTPLRPAHEGARLTDYAGWEMPVYYEGILAEHMAVRQAAGLFDVSHMARFLVEGPSALVFLQFCLTNDISVLEPGRALYSLLCNAEGGVLDDLIVYQLDPFSYLLISNAVNEENVFYWLEGHLPGQGVRLSNATEDYALLALQGPRSTEILGPLLPPDFSPPPYFRFEATMLLGRPAVLSRTGYTGEDGYELLLGIDSWPREEMLDLWRRFTAGGAHPCGLGARDTLRIEAGYPLYGHELTAVTNPLQAGLRWAVRFDKGDFIGRRALAEEERTEPVNLLSGFRMLERSVPRQGYPIFDDDEEVGAVTSGAYSPIRQEGIGMAYILEPFSSEGTRLTLDVRGRRLPLEVVARPFVTIRAGGRAGEL